MSLKNEPLAFDKKKCAKCHKDPLVRTIHLLRWMDQGADNQKIHSHLLQEFGKERDNDGFIKSEMIHLSFIREHYREPKNMPTWINWLEGKMDISRTSTGWRIMPKGCQ